jgi:ferritin-like protein
MASSSATLHEDPDVLGQEVIDNHRAIVSLMEELEAVDWYDQRVRAASDPQLAAILAHNRDEEKEHAMMVLEWLRRRDPKLDEHMRTYLFTSENILEIEDAAAAAEAGEAGEDEAAPPGDGSLGIGSLRGGSRK